MKKKNLFPAYPTCVLCNTMELPSYSDYEDFCIGFADCEPQGEDSEDYYNWCRETTQQDFDDLLSNLLYSEESKTPVVITGTLGLWNGRPTIRPVVCDNLHDAILKCLGSCDDIKVVLTEGHLDVFAYHHDGTNCFTVYKLSKKGCEYLDKHYDGFAHAEDLKDYHIAKFKGYLY